MPTSNTVYFSATAARGGGSTPVDTNDGRDRWGWSGTFAFTTSTKTLNLASAWTTYTFTAGDQIYIAGGTGVTAGLYTIASKTDASNIVLTEDIGGTDPADVTTSNGAFITLDKATKALAADEDEARICADGTYSPTGPAGFTAAAVAGEVWTLRGVGASGVPFTDGSMATVSGASITPTADILVFDQNFIHVRLMNLRLTAGVSDAIDIPNTSGIFAINCRFDNSVGQGIRQSNGNARMRLWFCEIDNNERGLGGVSFGLFTGCSFHDNTNFSIAGGTSGNYSTPVFDRCIFYSEATAIHWGISTNHSLNAPVVRNCVFFNCITGYNNDGSAGFIAAMYNNIFRSCTNAIDINAGDWEHTSVLFDYNCFSGNTTDIDVNGGVPPGDNNVTALPRFTNETAGSEDFTLRTGSPCIGTGFGQAFPFSGAGEVVGTGQAVDMGPFERSTQLGLSKSTEVGGSMRRLPWQQAPTVMFYLVAAVDGRTPTAGKSAALDITISKNGAAFADPSAGNPTITDRSNGWYSFPLLAADVDTLGTLAVRIQDTADPDTVGEVAMLFDVVPEPQFVTGSAEATPSATVTQTDLAEATDDHYNDAFLQFVNGVNIGAVRKITDYTGATGTLTHDAFPAGATAGDEFVIVNR